MLVRELMLMVNAVLMAVGWGFGSRFGCFFFGYLQLGRTLKDMAAWNNHDHLYMLLAFTLFASNAHDPRYSPLARAAVDAVTSASNDAKGASVSARKPAASAVSYSGWACFLYWFGILYLTYLNLAFGMIGFTVPLGMMCIWMGAYEGAYGRTISSQADGEKQRQPSSLANADTDSAVDAGSNSALKLVATILNMPSGGYGVGLLQWQLFGVYFHAAACKYCNDWLSGSTVITMLSIGPTMRNYPLLAAWLTRHSTMMAYGGLCVDIMLALSMWKTESSTLRKLFFFLGCIFHFSNHIFFELEAFPWVMMSAMVLLKPELTWFGYHQRGAIFVIVNGAAAMIASMIGAIYRALKAILKYGATALVVSVFSVTVLAPLPCTIWNLMDYNNDLSWGSQCAFFSWRMMFRHTELMQMKMWIHPGTALRPAVNLAFVHIDAESRTSGGLYKLISTQEDGANAIVRSYAKEYMEKPGSGGKKPKIYIDQFVAIDGPPFQRYFSPVVNMVGRKFPCVGWLEVYTDYKTPGVGECRLPSSIGGLLGSVWSSTVSKPTPLMKVVLPRLYRDYYWTAKLLAMKQDGVATGHHYIFMADMHHQVKKHMLQYQSWLTHALSSSPNTKTPINKTVEITVLDGSLIVHNHPGAPHPDKWGSSITMNKGDTMQLWENIEHAIEAQGDKVLWYYKSDKSIMPSPSGIQNLEGIATPKSQKDDGSSVEYVPVFNNDKWEYEEDEDDGEDLTGDKRDEL